VTAGNREPEPRQRDYGGWRRSRGIGLFGLGAAGTGIVLGALLLLAVLAAAAPAALTVAVPVLLAAGGLGAARAGGQPLALLALQRWRWHRAERREYTSYRAGVVAGYSPAWQLPGVLAPLALLDCEDGAGGRYGIVTDGRTGLMTATLRVSPASWWPADRDDADARSTRRAAPPAPAARSPPPPRPAGPCTAWKAPSARAA
jgi:hypothetical protein